MKKFFLLVMVALLAATVPTFALSEKPAPVPPERIIALVIAPEQFRDEELFVPQQILEKAGFGTLIAGPRLGTATGMLNGTVQITETIENLKSSDCEGLLIVGGLGSPAHLWDNTPLHTLANSFAREGKPVAAICLSPVVLAKAGLLKGKKATVFADPKAVEALKAGGAIPTGQPVVVDGLIITGNGPDAAGAFAEKLLELLELLESRKK